MTPKRAKVFLMSDPLIQLKKKTGRTCEKVEVYEYLQELVEKEEKYAWHDLRKNPDDLPNDNKKKLVIVQHNYEYDDWCSYDLAYYSESYYKWTSVTYNSSAYKIIAWCEINPYEVTE